LDLSPTAFPETEFNKMFSGRQLRAGVKVAWMQLSVGELYFCYLRLLDLEGGGSVRIYQPIQFSAMLLCEH
jgi:hypothetical protein